jgi:hypothetical protein
MAQDLQKYFQFSPFFVDSASMPDLAWEKLQDKIDRVPAGLANMLTNSKTSEFIEMLTQKYIQLSVQGPDVARIIRDVVIADIYIGDMPAQISSKLGVDQNTALEIARTIVSQLFAPVIDDIKKLQLQKFGKLPGLNQQQPTMPQKVPGEDLPESGGNIINLRQNSK